MEPLGYESGYSGNSGRRWGYLTGVKTYVQSFMTTVQGIFRPNDGLKMNT